MPLSVILMPAASPTSRRSSLRISTLCFSPGSSSRLIVRLPSTVAVTKQGRVTVSPTVTVSSAGAAADGTAAAGAAASVGVVVPDDPVAGGTGAATGESTAGVTGGAAGSACGVAAGAGVSTPPAGAASVLRPGRPDSPK